MMHNIDELRTLVLGRAMDGGVDEVEINCRRWIAAYPELTDYRLEVTSPGGIAYIAETVFDAGILTWHISQSDTAAAGEGLYQVVATGADGERKTSAHVKLMVLPVMDGTAGEEPPEASKAWTDRVAADAVRAETAAGEAESAAVRAETAAEDAKNAAKEAENAAVHPPVIGENGNWHLWEFEAGEYVDSGMKARGGQGNTGKTAYEYALDGGYTGTEEEFAAKLAQEIPVVDKTLSVAGAAAESLTVKDQLNSTKNVLVSLLNKKQPAGDYALRSELAAPVVAYDGTLAVNTVYTAELSGEVAFTLPTPTDVTRENRIRMLAHVAADTVIDWGTDVYYGAAVPFVNEGYYEFLWDYNPLLGAWAAGAARIGQVVAG